MQKALIKIIVFAIWLLELLASLPHERQLDCYFAAMSTCGVTVAMCSRQVGLTKASPQSAWESGEKDISEACQLGNLNTIFQATIPVDSLRKSHVIKDGDRSLKSS